MLRNGRFLISSLFKRGSNFFNDGFEIEVGSICSGDHGRFSPKVAEHLHSSSKNTKKKTVCAIAALMF